MVYLSHVLGAIEPISTSSDRMALVASVLAASDCSLCFAFDTREYRRPLQVQYSRPKSMY